MALLAVEFLGGFGSGKTTLCNVLQSRLNTAGVSVYRQSCYQQWRCGMTAVTKYLLLLKNWRHLMPIALAAVPFLTSKGCYCPVPERLRRLASVLAHRALLPVFARNRFGILLLDEWCVNQFASICMPCENGLTERLATLFYRDTHYIFVYIEKDVDHLTSNILKRSAHRVYSEKGFSNTAAAILASGDSLRIRNCAKGSSRFHDNSQKILLLCGMRVISWAESDRTDLGKLVMEIERYLSDE